MGHKIGSIFFIIIAFGILLYVLNSGIIGSSLGSLHTFSFTSASGTGSSIFPLFRPSPQDSISGNGGGGSSSGGGATVDAGGGAPAINPADVPAGFTIDQLSPYFHEVRLSGVSYGGYGFYGQITLASAFNATGTIDVTGWQIKTRVSGEYIPQAINLYDPSGLTASTDIRLGQNQEVFLYSSKGSFNLRLNKCIGYIANENAFTPSLPVQCPSLDFSQLQGVTGQCENYIQSLGSCQVPDLNNAQVPHYDLACTNYLENINYKTCFNNHLGDSDFLSNQWWVWTGANVVDQYHDQVKLLDKNGLLVDVYTY